MAHFLFSQNHKKGEWRNGKGSIYLIITFTDDGFTADMIVNGKPAVSKFAREGIVKMTDNVLTLWEKDGQKYIYFTYEIVDGIIQLTDYDGTEWIKQ